MSQQQPVIWISKRRLIEFGLLALVLVGGAVVAFRRGVSADAPILDSAQRVAAGLATRDLYLHPDAYKNDLSWSAYQQALATAPQYQQQNAVEPFNLTVSKYGAMFLLDQGVFGNSVTALVRTFVKKKTDGTATLLEFQLQMVPDGATWKVNNVTTLNKGNVTSQTQKP
jgi:hypothetical protein